MVLWFFVSNLVLNIKQESSKMELLNVSLILSCGLFFQLSPTNSITGPFRIEVRVERLGLLVPPT